MGTIKQMACRRPSESIEWLASLIRRFPYDERVADRTPGYNTQKDHWLGWLNPTAGTGSYPRANKQGLDACGVYKRIVKPKLLLWLASAAGVQEDLVAAAKRAAKEAPSMAGKSGAICMECRCLGSYQSPLPGLRADNSREG